MDSQFTGSGSCEYLRYVDDTTVFCRDEVGAETIKREHHLALRSVGLNPDAENSSITTVEEFQEHRHVDINRKIAALREKPDTNIFNDLVKEWYNKKGKVVNWSSVTKQLYGLAKSDSRYSLKRRIM